MATASESRGAQDESQTIFAEWVSTLLWWLYPSNQNGRNGMRVLCHLIDCVMRKRKNSTTAKKHMQQHSPLSQRPLFKWFNLTIRILCVRFARKYHWFICLPFFCCCNANYAVMRIQEFLQFWVAPRHTQIEIYSLCVLHCKMRHVSLSFRIYKLFARSLFSGSVHVYSIVHPTNHLIAIVDVFLCVFFHKQTNACSSFRTAWGLHYKVASSCCSLTLLRRLLWANNFPVSLAIAPSAFWNPLIWCTRHNLSLLHFNLNWTNAQFTFLLCIVVSIGISFLYMNKCCVFFRKTKQFLREYLSFHS